MANSSWTCPYCGHIQTLTEGKIKVADARVPVGSGRYPNLAARIHAIGCSNPDCEEVQVTAYLGRYSVPPGGGVYAYGDTFATFRLKPDSVAKPQPDYIPDAIRVDYGEACRIAHLSPKASATLSRRCIQGMIRDFCGISKARLVDEINALKSLAESDSLPRGVTPESIDAIDAVRKIGNIGAHMEKDINLIVDVDPEEATTLIELIETLFDDWYIARQKRVDRFARVSLIASQKATEKQGTQ